MGTCVSVHKHQAESGLKVGLSSGSKNSVLVIPSPIKEKHHIPKSNDAHLSAVDVGLKSQSLSTFRDHLGSKEETFFDSQPWLESDCEDDFYSVNGDFTPSRGNTPVNHSFSVGTQILNRSVFMEKAPAITPEPPKKRLSELFRESLREVRDIDDENVSRNENEGNVVYGSKRTPTGETKMVATPLESGHCCIPRLRSNHSFERKKKTKT